MMSKSAARSATRRIIIMKYGIGSRTDWLSRNAIGTHGTSSAAVIEIAAGEQRHVVSEANKFFSEIRHDPLGSAVKARRNAFAQRCDLRNSHGSLSGRLRHGSLIGKKAVSSVILNDAPRSAKGGDERCGAASSWCRFHKHVS